MRKRNFTGRCTKRYVPKCTDICCTYNALQEAYADVLSQSNDVKEFRSNVYLEGLAEGIIQRILSVRKLTEQSWQGMCLSQ